jgi:hypothetical protein
MSRLPRLSPRSNPMYAPPAFSRASPFQEATIMDTHEIEALIAQADTGDETAKQALLDLLAGTLQGIAEG